MVVKDLERTEAEYFGNHNHMVVPDLICTYYENREYEIVCYLSQVHMETFRPCEFYYMMALMELGYAARAAEQYEKHRSDWFEVCRQLDIYWKHVVLFALYFKNLNITDYYMEVFDDYYETELVQLTEYLVNNGPADIDKLQIFQNATQQYPVIAKVWAVRTPVKEKSLLCFQDVQWSIWKKENQDISNGNRLGIAHTFSGLGIEVYSYKPKQVAASMQILTDGETTILLDCGCEVSGEDTQRIPVREILDELAIERIEAVFISHAHMDHYGSLNELKSYKVYMTKETRQLIRCVSPDVYLGNTSVVNGYEAVAVGGVTVRFVPNGHIKGSVLFDIDWKNSCRIVFTGDFSVEDQKTVPGFQIKDLLGAAAKRIDLLITETTYGSKKNMFRLHEYEKMFLFLCEKHIRYGNKVIIPCFAIGRAQESALLLSDAADKYGWRILIDGLAAKVTECYQSFPDASRKILNKNISVCHCELDYNERIENNEIILASSGMLKPGSTSAMYLSSVIDREKICIIKVGFIHESEHLLQSILRRKNRNLHYVDLSLSAHAGYRELIQVIDRLSPDHVVYVHGAGIV